MNINDISTSYLDNYENFLIHDNFKVDLLRQVNYLTSHHYIKCRPYRSFVNKIFPDYSTDIGSLHLEEIPYLPVNMFKEFKLSSITEENIFKVLQSSGTTSQLKSKIYLDKDTAKNQSVGLSKIFTDFTGLKRPRILIIDSPDLIKRSSAFSARKAGIIGFSALCRKPLFALNSDMSINLENIYKAFENDNEYVLLYGFTYIIWSHLLHTKLPDDLRKKLSTNSILLHGGGWKKLNHLQITKEDFNNKSQSFLGVQRVINYYGMVEQTGSIFMECENGYLHSNPLCDVLPRSVENIQVIDQNNVSLAQVISALPTSYPGHSLLTDDLIKIHNKDKCRCNRKGTVFEVIGRIQRSEPRGCSDTYEYR
ncbi:hypothetical protein [Prochlorococcus marinus]|uniref:LuxE/PaaK family acyltransferase n=1 Tax=Prochlorococcus marinus TaxID=1219 RepID=UPI0022B4CC30|nr:hypothetical protein [Prochlorococcus marinus]